MIMMILLCCVGVIFHVQCCIRRIRCSSIISYHITSIAYNHHNHTDITYPLFYSASVMGQVQSALSNVKNDAELKKSAEQAYGAWLGYYNTNCKKCGWSKEMLVQRANEMASDLGLDYQPRLQKKTVGKMGLKGVAGLLTE